MVILGILVGDDVNCVLLVLCNGWKTQLGHVGIRTESIARAVLTTDDVSNVAGETHGYNSHVTAVETSGIKTTQNHETTAGVNLLAEGIELGCQSG